MPKITDPLPKVPPDAATMETILDGMPTGTAYQFRDKAYVEILYGTMLRFSEALGLNLCDADLDERTVTVRKGKGAKDRVVPLPVKSIETLERYLAVREDLFYGKAIADGRQAFFVGRSGKRMAKKALRELFRRLKKETGLKALHPHLLRHAGAVHMLRGNADLRYIQEALGHEQLDTTKRYTRLVPADFKKAYDAAFPVLRV